MTPSRDPGRTPLLRYALPALVLAFVVLAWDLVDGEYRVAGQANGSENLELKLPFPVTVMPSALLAGYNW